MLITGAEGKGCAAGRDLGLDGVMDHFTLSGDEAGWLRNKTGSTRLGFAVQLKYLTWRGRFPKMRLARGPCWAPVTVGPLVQRLGNRKPERDLRHSIEAIVMSQGDIEGP
ncbi:DUF4158 domain-containing protein [Streptomyces sp. x-80]|uniref:DUF4158 domain-containing protein n=1 Tax=Streptomyces sp. x-80 TaxID=2789282 RepID=UPI00397FDC43